MDAAKRQTLKHQALLSDAYDLLLELQFGENPCNYDTDDLCLEHGERRYCRIEKARKWLAEYEALDALETANSLWRLEDHGYAYFDPAGHKMPAPDPDDPTRIIVFRN